jgi:hypothetical protein
VKLHFLEKRIKYRKKELNIVLKGLVLKWSPQSNVHRGHVYFIWKMKKDFFGQGWWLTPVILATWEMEIRRIAVGASPGIKVERPHLNQ